MLLLGTAAARADTLIVPGAVWDGVSDAPVTGQAVLVRGERIAAVGPVASLASAGAERIDLPGTTLVPGLIEGHSHLLLHPYNQTLWDDQVLKEPYAYRVAAAVAHAGATLRAGITTERDLGTAPHDQDDARDDHHDAEQPQLLTDHSQDEVRVGLRAQVAPLGP